jgi:hypothetical protein
MWSWVEITNQVL